MSLEPRLSITLRTFAADDPGTWEPVIDQARAADAAGEGDDAPPRARAAHVAPLPA